MKTRLFVLIGLLLAAFALPARAQNYSTAPAGFNPSDEGAHVTWVAIPNEGKAICCNLRVDRDRLYISDAAGKKPTKTAFREMERRLNDRRMAVKDGDEFRFTGNFASMAQLKNVLDQTVNGPGSVSGESRCAGLCGGNDQRQAQAPPQVAPPVPYEPPTRQVAPSAPQPVSKSLNYVGFCGTEAELLDQLEKDGVEIKKLNDKPLLPSSLGGHPARLRSEYVNPVVKVYVKGKSLMSCSLATQAETIFVLPHGTGIWADLEAKDKDGHVLWFVNQIDYFVLPSGAGFIFSPKACQPSAPCGKR